MSKKLTLFFLIVGLLFVVGCSDEETTLQKEDNQQTTENEEIQDIASYIGESIEITSEGSIHLPFQQQVLAADFSDDGEMKAFALLGYILIIDGEEIIHAEEAFPRRFDIASDEIKVSSDGRFITWLNRSAEDLEINVFDTESRERNTVKKTEDQDPTNIHAPHIIEKHGDTYYLLNNDYWAAMGYGSDMHVLDLNNLEIINDQEITDQIFPKEPIEDHDKYHTLKAEASEIGLEDGHYAEFGYYKYFYEYEEIKDDKDAIALLQLYGGDTANSVLKEIKIEDLELGTDDIRVAGFREIDTEQLQVGDNGMYVLPLVTDGKIEENEYDLRVYIADFTEDEPVATLLIEEKVSGVRPAIIFNEDETAIYYSKPGVMEKYIIKE